jgi:hypothetical protein
LQLLICDGNLKLAGQRWFNPRLTINWLKPLFSRDLSPVRSGNSGIFLPADKEISENLSRKRRLWIRNVKKIAAESTCYKNVKKLWLGVLT